MGRRERSQSSVTEVSEDGCVPSPSQDEVQTHPFPLLDLWTNKSHLCSAPSSQISLVAKAIILHL